MDRLKTLGTWVLLVIAFYIFSQVITYLFLGGPNTAQEGATNNDITNSITNEVNETNTQNTATNNTVTNRIKILN